MDSEQFAGGLLELCRKRRLYRVLSEEKGTVRVYDATGRLLLTSSTEEAFALPAAGPCIIQVYTPRGTTTFRTLTY